jgi:hypothetical protein
MLPSRPCALMSGDRGADADGSCAAAECGPGETADGVELGILRAASHTWSMLDEAPAASLRASGGITRLTATAVSR